MLAGGFRGFDDKTPGLLEGRLATSLPDTHGPQTQHQRTSHQSHKEKIFWLASRFAPGFELWSLCATLPLIAIQ